MQPLGVLDRSDSTQKMTENVTKKISAYGSLITAGTLIAGFSLSQSGDDGNAGILWGIAFILSLSSVLIMTVNVCFATYLSSISDDRATTFLDDPFVKTARDTLGVPCFFFSIVFALIGFILNTSAKEVWIIAAVFLGVSFSAMIVSYVRYRQLKEK